jgi:hypothetical protein
VSGDLLLFFIDLHKNTFACGKRVVQLRHHKAALFLGNLIAASAQSRELSKSEFLAAWAHDNPLVAPDRTAMSRIIAAVRAGLDALLPDGAARLEVAARCLTTGPWHLRMLSHESWQVQGAHHLKEQAEPYLTADIDPLAWCKLASALAMADAMLKEGHYPEAASMLVAQVSSLPLSDSAWCMWQLRLVRVLRRLGQYTQAQDIADKLALHSTTLNWRMSAHVKNKTALVLARSKFDALPHHTSLGVDFKKLRETVDTAPNVALQWEWCNLHALSLRRLIERKLQTDATPSLVKGLANDAVQAFGAAYFWAALAKDAYHCQAIACNFAYTLHWLDSRGLYDGLAASIDWFCLAHTLVDRFDLPQDSAWDFLMLGELYLGSDNARARIAADAMSWPEQTNPAQEVFYLRAYDLACRYGNARQQIMALNQHILFFD